MFVAALLSLDVETSLIDKEGVSSSVIVNVPVASLIVAFDALDKSHGNCFIYFIVESARTVIGIVPVVLPALIVNVPFVAV